MESLRKDIEVLSQNHERDVDRKDAIIQMLDRDLEEAEEQYQMTLRRHLRHVDELVDLQVSACARAHVCVCVRARACGRKRVDGSAHVAAAL